MEMTERRVEDVDPVTVKATSWFPVRFQDALSRNEGEERKEAWKEGCRGPLRSQQAPDVARCYLASALFPPRSRSDRCTLCLAVARLSVNSSGVRQHR